VPLLEQVLEQYPEEIKLVFKNFPLRNHKFAGPAAMAAMAANEQGKFWEFHDLIFANYNKLSEEKLQEIAVTLDLDMDRFAADRKDQKLQQQVQRDMRDGQQAGVRGTPTVLINGRLLKNRSPQGFQQLIDRLLRKSAPSAEGEPQPAAKGNAAESGSER
jgi:protein-disulfide isomerase